MPAEDQIVIYQICKPKETTASRTRLNIIGAMKLNDISKTISERYDTINAESIIHHL